MRLREEKYFEITFLLIAVFLAFGSLFLILEIISSSLIWWQGAIYIFLLTVFATLSLLFFTYLSERRIDHYSESNPYLEYLIKREILPGFYILLRDLEEFSALEVAFPDDGFTKSELEIIECLVRDGSELSIKELTTLAKNLDRVIIEG